MIKSKYVVLGMLLAISSLVAGLLPFNTSTVHADTLENKIDIVAVSTTDGSEYIELYNNSEFDLSTQSIHIYYHNSSNKESEIKLDDGTFAAMSSLLVGQIENSDIKFLNNSLANSGAGIKIVVDRPVADFQETVLCWGSNSNPVNADCGDERYEKSNGITSNRVLVSCKYNKDIGCTDNQVYKLVVLDLYMPKFGGFELIIDEIDDPPSPPVTIKPCRLIKLNEISFATGQMFVEIINESDQKIELDNCSVHRGTVAVALSGTLVGGGVASFVVKDVTIKEPNTDVNIYIYESDVRINDSLVKYKKVKASASWAWFDTDEQSGWLQTFAPTPGEENIYQQFQTCEEGKMINPETGNCIKVPTSFLECPAGQYRNPDTNRCRKLPTETVLSVCPEGSFRNPDTNRCKKLASETVLSACQVGYERNPETNRCRKIIDSSSPTFAVQNVPTSQETNIMIAVAAGGVGVTLAMIIWSFRQEINRGIGKLFRRKAIK